MKDNQMIQAVCTCNLVSLLFALEHLGLHVSESLGSTFELVRYVQLRNSHLYGRWCKMLLGVDARIVMLWH